MQIIRKFNCLIIIILTRGLPSLIFFFLCLPYEPLISSPTLIKKSLDENRKGSFIFNEWAGKPLRVFITVPDELDEKILEMINVDKPVIFDCHVDQAENCFPMIPSGKPHNQMLLGPKDQEENKITGKGKALV